MAIMSNKRPPDGPTRDRSPPSKRRMPSTQPNHPAKSNTNSDVASIRQRIGSGSEPSSSRRNSQEVRPIIQNGRSESPVQGALLAPNMVPAANNTPNRSMLDNLRERHAMLQKQAPRIDSTSDHKLVSISTSLLRDLQCQVKSQAVEFEEFKKDRRELEKKVTSQATEIGRLKDQLTKQSTELAQATSQVGELEKNSQTYKDQVDSLRKERVAQKSELESLKTELESQKTVLKTQQAKLVAQQMTMNAQQTKLGDMGGKRDDQQKMIDTRMQSLEAQQKTVDTLQNAVDAQQKKQDAQQQTLDKQLARVGALEKTAQSLLSNKEEREAHNGRLANLEKETKGRHGELEKLEKKAKAHAQSLVDGLQTQLNTQVIACGKIKKDLENQRAQDNQTRESKIQLLNKLKEDVSSLVQQQRGFLDQVNDLTSRVQGVETAKQPDGPSMDQLQEQVESTEKLKTRIEQLEAKRQNGQNGAPHTNTTEVNGELDNVFTDLGTLFDAHEQLQEQVRNLPDEAKGLKKEVKDLKLEMKVMRERMGEALGTAVVEELKPFRRELEDIKSQQVASRSTDDTAWKQEFTTRDIRILAVEKKLNEQDGRIQRFSTSLTGKLDGNDLNRFLQFRDNRLDEIDRKLSDNADGRPVDAIIRKHDGIITELQKKMAIRVDNDAIEGQFSNIRLAVRSLEDRYNNITTDNIYDGMVRMFLSRFPNNQAQLVHQVADLQTAVQRIGGLDTIALHLQDLQRKIAQFGVMQRTLQQLSGDVGESRQMAQNALNQIKEMETKVAQTSNPEERIKKLEGRPTVEEAGSTALSDEIKEMRRTFGNEHEIRVKAENRINDAVADLKTDLELVTQKADALEKLLSDVQKYMDDTIKPRENFFEYSSIILPCLTELQKAVDDLNRGHRSAGLSWGHDLNSLFIPEPA